MGKRSLPVAYSCLATGKRNTLAHATRKPADSVTDPTHAGISRCIGFAAASAVRCGTMSTDLRPPIQSGFDTADTPRTGRTGSVLGFAFRAIRNILALVMLGLIVLVMSPLENRIYDWLNVSSYELTKADAILCLGGSWGREHRAAILWHRKVAPIIVVSNKLGAAEWMRTLVMDVGVPRNRILVDNTSATTEDHPEGIGRLPGIDREKQKFVIVTDRPHSRRARDCFLKAGYKNITVWSGFRPVPKDTYLGQCAWRVYNLPPLIYETTALVKYKILGKV